MFRKLRVLAAFFMVPVVLLANPQTAAAAGAEWHTLSFNVPAAPIIGDSAPGTIDSIDCTFSLANLGGWSLSIGPGYCYGLPDVTPGWTQSGEAGSSYSIAVSGLAASNVACSGDMSSTLAPHSKNGTVRVAGTITPGSMSYSPEDCHITEVCLTLVNAGGTDCISVDIPPYEEEELPVTGNCVMGTPSVETRWVTVTHPTLGGNYRQTRWEARFTIHNPDPFSTWGYRGYYQEPNGTVRQGWDNSMITNDWKQIGPSVDWITTSGTPPTKDTMWKPIGFEVFARMLIGSEVWNETQPVTALAGKYAVAPYPPGRDAFFGGWTDPSHCRFWTGQKVLNVEGLDGDEPHLPLDQVPAPPAPPVQDPPPTIEDTQPVIDEPTDEESWLGALWALLRSIWGAITSGFNAVVSAIKGLGTTIADAISALFDAAFVPEDGFMEQKFTTVTAKWDNTSPGRYMAAFGDFSTGTGTGCQGVPVNVDLGGGVMMDEQIGAACTGPLASASQVVRLTLSAMLVIGGAVACLRAIGSGLGWNPGIGGNVSA